MMTSGGSGRQWGTEGAHTVPASHWPTINVKQKIIIPSKSLSDQSRTGARAPCHSEINGDLVSVKMIRHLSGVWSIFIFCRYEEMFTM